MPALLMCVLHAEKGFALNIVAAIKRYLLVPAIWHKLLRVAALGVGLLAVLLVVLALVLHAWILPRINDFRPRLEQSASSALGLTVKIGEIAAIRQGWKPAVQLRNVRFLDQAGNEGLRTDVIEAEATVLTLMRGRVARLAVMQPVLHTWRNADGRIYVAGIALPQGPETAQTLDSGSGSDAALNWLLRQPELELHAGSVQWRDAQRQVAPLAISQVRASLKNSGRQHMLQLALTPPSGWGQPITAAAEWKHGLLHEPARWNKWSGAVQADVAELDVSQLRQYVDLGKDVALREGRGRLRVRAEYNEGLRSGMNIQAGLQAVDITLGKNLPPLSLKGLDGTFRVRFNQNGGRNSYTLATEGLSFETHDGLRWNGGNVQISYHDAEDPGARGGEVKGNDWDIGLIGQLASRLPLGDAALKALRRYQPQGMVHELQLGWQGDINAPSAYTARGSASHIGWLAQPGTATATQADKQSIPPIGTPGVQGAKISFAFDQAGGNMELNLDKGSAEFPGVFEKPRLEFDALQTKVLWNIQGQQIKVTLPEIRFANSDAQGTARVAWRTYDGAVNGQRFPGMLDLDGRMHRARAEQVARYLPLGLGRDALDYVGNAVRSGDIRDARVRIEGDLKHVPFGKDAQGKEHPGTFRFDVPLSNAEYRFVPRYLQKPSDKDWPALTSLKGKLVIDKMSLSVLDATARFSTAPDIVVHELSAHIPRLDNNLVVGVAARMQGPLEQALALTNQSALSDILGNSLEQVSANGQADIMVKLGLPIMHMKKALVSGTVALQNNDVRISPDSPLLAQSQGKVQFNEKGFALQDVSTTLLGGRATLKGGSEHGSQRSNGSHPVKVEAQGEFTAEGLRQEPSVGTIAQLGRFLQGRSAYRATLFMNRGASELSIDSDLQGMEVKFPAPLGKGAAGRLPFHFSNRVTKSEKVHGAEKASEDELEVRFGHTVLAQYVRDLRHGDTPRVLRGRIAVGEQAVKHIHPAPATGVHALVLMDRVNADAWSGVLESGWGDQVHPVAAQQGQVAVAHGATSKATVENAETAAASYLPDQFIMQTPALAFAGRVFDSLVVGGEREGRLWRLSLTAKQLNGDVEYLQSATGGPGGVKARLLRLVLGPANVQEVNEYVRQTADPKSLPTLDIDARNVDLVGYKFDRITLRASNSARPRPAGADLSDDAPDLDTANGAWRIHELTALMPHASLHGNGVWGVNRSHAGGGLDPSDLARRFVSLQIRAQTQDLGGTLDHLGQKGLVKAGQGSVSGTLRWQGSPVNFDLETLAGELRLDIRSGHITHLDPGALKLVSLLSLQGLTRLGSMAEKGFAFDRIDGSVRVKQGVARTENLAIAGAMADAKMRGDIALAKKNVDMHVVVQPKVDLSTAALAVGVINPLVGVGSYVVQWALSKPISALATQTLHVHGALDDPAVVRLQGKEASQAKQQVLGGHAVPATFNSLWNWTPISGNRQNGSQEQTEADVLAEDAENESDAESRQPAPSQLRPQLPASAASAAGGATGRGLSGDTAKSVITANGTTGVVPAMAASAASSVWP